MLPPQIVIRTKGINMVTSKEIIPTVLFKAGEAAKYLSVGVTFLYAKSGTGELPKPIRVGRVTRWRKADLDKWIANAVNN
jgi:excisionase family DNA binding protein